MAEPLPEDPWRDIELTSTQTRETKPPPAPPPSRVIRSADITSSGADADSSSPGLALSLATEGGGRLLGSFRNTYYDFPREVEFKGPRVALKAPNCDTIQQVPREFFESLCVQGSGTLKTGVTVSFAKRDCACAELCPRTAQRICFDALDGQSFPWGRGATGKAITPLLTVAVDTSVVPLGSVLYVPEFHGLPRDPAPSGRHDGCFVAQDRGIRVQGQHIDVFTGDRAMTALWNRLVPSNQGVSVVLDSPRCSKIAR